MNAKTVLSALAVVSAITAPVAFSPRSLALNPPAAGIDKLTFHHNRQRTGWNDRETVLTPNTVSSPHFGLLWESLPLDYYNGRPPRLFAAPLYVHAVAMTQGPLAGRTASALYAVTTTGYAYAINAAQAGATAPGDLLWRQQLAEEPCFRGMMGNTATPIIDLERQRFYVTSCSSGNWRAHALDIRSGEPLPGWPVAIDAEALNAPGIHKNGSARRFVDHAQRKQRGALNLSPDGSRLYITFGEPGGWIVSVDTGEARVASSFSATASDDELVMGGIWASGGPAVDDQGYVYVSTGTSEKKGRMEHVFDDSPGNWGQSILQLRDDPVRGFELVGTYTPFNYCIASAWDIDLASSGTVVIDLDPKMTSTPRLLALGGAKQGNVYLVNRAPMPGRLSKRQPCSEDSESDLSLLAPEPQPHFGKRGPINVFGPYSETKGLFDQARSRSTLAYFRDDAGKSYTFVTGAAKTGPKLTQSVPPGLARLQIVTAPGEPAFLRPTHLEMTHTLYNASSPIVTSNGGLDATVWVLDTNAERSVPLYGPNAPQPVLYAFDATNLKLLWKSTPGQLATTGKYNEPTVVNGVVYVGTDRIQAFGVRPPSPPSESRFTSLFDGRTLTQWRGDPAFWSVRDGAITGGSTQDIPANTLLMHEGNFRNFELRFHYRFRIPGSSGLQLRSRPHPAHPLSVMGYQANLVPPSAKEHYAMLQEEHGRQILALLGEQTEVTPGEGGVSREVLQLVNPAERVLAADRAYPEWNEYVVIAYGNRVVQAVNGVLAADVTDNDVEGRPVDGSIALQVHAGPPMEVQFKDLEIRPLSSAPDLAARFVTAPTPVSPPAPEVAFSETVATGRDLYAQRCAGCHNIPQPVAPPQASLAQLPPQQIVDELVHGAMRAEATGLSRLQISAIAAYLTSPTQGE